MEAIRIEVQPIQFLLVSDFDGTEANTFKPSPNGLGVNEAYEESVKLIFGQAGHEIFKYIGGLKNRAPGELVAEILDADDRRYLIAQAKKYFSSASATLQNLVPANKGVKLEWRDNDPDWIPTPTIAEMLVRTKLSLLYKEIGKETSDGQIWPAPCLGFQRFYKTLEKINNEGKIHFEMAIISSGHDKFIEKTFQSWNLPCPHIMVTDDDMRGLTTPTRLEDRVKPAPFLFDLVHSRWLHSLQLDLSPAQLIGEAVRTRERMIYFGDDLTKDGQLAINSNVPFGWFHLNGNGRQKDAHVIFNDWRAISDRLMAGRKELAKTGSLKQFFT